eukprot:gnl/TRDRNA2_/TRDRNA2_80064_c1_seq1.p1 gnl/TRDRNA2_/TRDRNA2_80064_c1~~gnl/TRDRNA2_/TRDRNA2_80064_c1_seq1.p1  ORF type:complete len:496 (+),score=46.30 gnl/TRDRNA2_/TRDRNA2_80064_c1_seq1:46-1533(+)
MGLMGVIFSGERQSPKRGLSSLGELRSRVLRSQVTMRDEAKILVQVWTLGGESWYIQSCTSARGLELRARVAALAQIPLHEVRLVGRAGACVKDEDLPLVQASDDQEQLAEAQIQLVRVRGHFALSGFADGTMKVWDLDRAICVETLFAGRHISCLAVDWRSWRALSGCSDGTLKIWDLQHAVCIETLQAHERNLVSLAADWRSKRALSGSSDGTLKLWDLDGAVCIGSFKHSSCSIRDRPNLALDWDSRCALSWSTTSYTDSGRTNGKLKIWDLDRAVCIKELWAHGDGVGDFQEVAVDWGSRCALSGGQWRWAEGEDGLEGFEAGLMLWDLNSAVCIQTFRGHRQPVICITVDWNSRRALSSSADGEMKMWHLDRATCLATLRDSQHAPMFMAVDWASQRAIIAGDRQTGAGDHKLKVWDLDRGTCIQTFESRTGADGVSGFKMDWGARRMLSVSDDGALKIWNLDRSVCAYAQRAPIYQRVTCIAVNAEDLP